ncbi:MAG TPA: MlaD family protein [Polyangiaceae bacterium]|nr:MlaD family protein [Polyangiaceae bacterium]
MATGTNHYKLGLFVLLGLALSLTAVLTLGASSWNEQSVGYVTYFDESVQGLEVGSPVKFRGVAVGRVAAIGIAPDQRHVKVTSELTVPELERLNLGGTGESLAVHPDLRAQLAQAGITGVKFVLIDYFDPDDYPPPVLPFEVTPNTIPAAASTLKGLEASVVKTADHFPEIAEDLRSTMARLDSLMAGVERAKLPEQAGEALGQATQAMKTLTVEIDALDAGELSTSVRKSLGAFDAATVRVTQLIDRLEKPDGVLASAERSFTLVSEMARSSSSVGPELELTLREVRGAARSIRRFTDALERDPDMLLKGRAQP